VKRIVAIAFSLVLLLNSCVEREDPLVLVFEDDVVVAGATSAKVIVRCSHDVSFEFVNGFLSQSPDMSNPVMTDAEINGTMFALKFNGLQTNTTYYYQYEWSNGFGVVRTEIRSLATRGYGKPAVSTSDVSDIKEKMAACGGDVFDNGGYDVTARGVCWSTSPNPTLSDSHTTDGSGTGTFASSLVDLRSNTTYYVRAFATNSHGTSYGEQVVFTTRNVCFSVSYNKKVSFSQGNLQYQATTDTWRFAEHQWDYIGDDNENISSDYSGWIDLFGWGTGKNPCQTSNYYDDYDPYYDWGINAISNGGNTPDMWRTLTRDEWSYLLNDRYTISGIRYAKAQINGVNGLIILPDKWSSSTYNLINANDSRYDYTDNTMDLTTWTNVLEADGAVFLPAAGSRSGTTVFYDNSYCYYWSATDYSSASAYALCLNYMNLNASYINGLYNGFSVRLVQDM